MNAIYLINHIYTAKLTTGWVILENFNNSLKAFRVNMLLTKFS